MSITTVTTAGSATKPQLLSREDLPPKLLSYAGLHDAIVRDLDRLERVATAATRAPSTLDGVGLARWWERFERSIVHHHEREDTLVFPLLVERGATIDAVLTEDHHELDRLMEMARQRVTVLREQLDAGAAAAFGDCVSALAVHMADHLGREEASVFPAYDRLLDDEANAELERGMRKGMSLRDMAFEAPWVLDEAHPRLDAQLDTDLPAPLRFMIRRVWTRRYVSLAAPVLAGARR